MQPLGSTTSGRCSADFTGWRLLNGSPISSQFWHSNVSLIWHQCTCMANYVDQQTLKPDDYVLPHQLLWTFDVLVCPLSVTEHFLSQPLICGTVFHVTAAPFLSIFCCRLKSHLFSLSYPAFWLFSHLYNACTVTHHFGHYNRYYRWHLFMVHTVFIVWSVIIQVFVLKFTFLCLIGFILNEGIWMRVPSCQK